MTTSHATSRRTSWTNAQESDCKHASRLLEVVGQRWSASVLLALARGAARFSEVIAAVEGLSARMLTLRLKQLESAGLVSRTVIPTTPVTIDYQLTEQGFDLVESLGSISDYVRRWGPG